MPCKQSRRGFSNLYEISDGICFLGKIWEMLFQLILTERIAEVAAGRCRARGAVRVIHNIASFSRFLLAVPLRHIQIVCVIDI